MGVCKNQEACSLVDGEPEPVNPITFNCLDIDAIIHAALLTYGATGRSGLDAYAWKTLLFFQVCPIASEGCCIATTSVNPKGVSAFVAFHLIPLDKCPGVRLTGVGEVPRSIIAKAILKIIGSHVEKAAGPLQLCAGQDGGCEEAFFMYLRLRPCS